MILLHIGLEKLLLELSTDSTGPPRVSTANTASPTLTSSTSAYAASYLSSSSKSLSSVTLQEMFVSARSSHKVATSKAHKLVTTVQQSSIEISLDQSLSLVIDESFSPQVEIELLIRPIESQSAGYLVASSPVNVGQLLKSSNPKATIKFSSLANSHPDSSYRLSAGSLGLTLSSTQIPADKMPALLSKPVNVVLKLDEAEEKDFLSILKQSSNPWSEQTKELILNALDSFMIAHNAQKTQTRELLTVLEESQRNAQHLKDCRRSLASLQAKLSLVPTKYDLNPDIEKMSLQIAAKDQLIAALRAENEKVKPSAVKQVVKGASDADIDRVKAELTEAKATIDSLKSTNSKLQIKLADSEINISKLQEILSSITNQFDKVSAELRDTPSSEEIQTSRKWGAVVEKLLDYEMKVTSSLSDLYYLTHPRNGVQDPIETNIKEIRTKACEQGEEIAALLEKQSELLSTISHLTNELDAQKADNKRLKELSEPNEFAEWEAHPSQGIVPKGELEKAQQFIEAQTQQLNQAAEYVKYQDDTIASLQEEIALLRSQLGGNSSIDLAKGLYESKLEKAAEYIKYLQEQLQARESEPSSASNSEELVSSVALNKAYEEKLQQAAEYVQYMQDQQTALEEELTLLRNSNAQSHGSTEEVSKLKKQIADYEAKLKQAQDYVVTIQEQHQNAEREILRLASKESELASLKELLSVMQIQNKEQKGEYEAKVSQGLEYISALKRQNDLAANELDRLEEVEKTATENAERCRSLETELEKAQQLVAAYEEKMKQAAEYIAYQQEQSAALEGELSKARQDAQQNQSHSEEAVREYVAEIEAKLQLQAKEYEAKILKGSQLIQELQRNQAKTQEELDKTRREKHSLENEKLAALTEELSQSQEVIKVYEEKLNKAAEYVAYLQDQYSALEDETNSLRAGSSSVSVSSEEVSQLKAKVVMYEEKLKQGQDYVTYLQEQHRAAEAELETLRASSKPAPLSKTADKEAAALKKQVGDLEARLAQMKGDYEAKFLQAKDQVASLQKQLSSAEKQVDAFKQKEKENESIDAAMAAHLQSLGDAVADLQRKLDDSEALVTAYEEKLKQAAEYVAYLQEQQTETESELNRLKGQGRASTPLSDQTKAELERQIALNKSLITRQEEMVATLRQTEASSKEKDLSIAALEDKLRSLEAKLKDPSSKSNSAAPVASSSGPKDEVQALRRQIVEMKAAHAEALQDHEYVVTELVEMKLRFAEMKEEADTDKKLISKLRLQVQALRPQIAASATPGAPRKK